MKIDGIKMRGGSAFHKDLRQRVNDWFTDNDIATSGDSRMWLKTATILGGFALCYGLYLAFGDDLAVALAIAVPFGLFMAGMGFSVMHDGNHGAYGTHPETNHWMGYVLDLLGGSSFMWKHKHNRLHHSHPNIVGADDDLEAGFFLRMAPGQPWLGMHRWQHVYCWPLYGLIVVKWHFVDDFASLHAGHLMGFKVPPLKGRDKLVFWLGKAVFFTWALVVPILVLGLATAVTFYLVSTFILGMTLAVVFQLAHCVEEADFVVPDADAPQTLDWATHQLATTIDFADGNRLATWYLGGLNYQVVHHLFPRICHVHYPDLARILAETCAEHGLRYRTQPTVRGALRSHYRWMRRMGQRPAAVEAATVEAEATPAAA